MKNTRTAVVLLVLAIAGVLIFLFFKRSPPPKPKPKGEVAAGGMATSTWTFGRTAASAIPRPAASGAASSNASTNANGRALFSSRWGGGPDELGHERPSEGNPFGPMSFAQTTKGRVVVLDGANGRLVRRGADGSPDKVIPIGATNPEDIAVGEDGAVAVLDRFADKNVSVYDDSGALRAEIPLEGEGVDDVGSVTGVFVDGSDIYVEREHGTLVKIGDTSGLQADPRTEIPGRPSRDGELFLHAGITEAPAGRVYVSAIERVTNEHRFTRELRLGAFVRTLQLLDSDKQGTIYLAAEVDEGEGAVILLTCMEPTKGAPIGGAVIPSNTLPEESFRDFIVLDEGGVLHALRTDQGVSYERYDCQ